MTRRLLASLALLASCAPKSAVELPIPDNIRSLLYFIPRPGGTGSDLYAIEHPIELLTASGTSAAALMFGFEQDLEALDLIEGKIGDDGAILTRAPPRADLAFALAPDGTRSERSLIAPPEVRLPAHDWNQILRSGRCSAGPDYLSTVCGSTVSFTVATPALPRIAASCPSGWSRVPEVLERGERLDPVTVERCEPPPRLSCGRTALQSAGDLSCRPIGQACLPGDEFPAALPSGRALIFVRAGALAGDGSRARPYATIGEAIAQAGADAVIVAGKGDYDEALTLRGNVDLLGACPAETRLRGTLRLSTHRGTISNLSLGSVVAEDAVTTIAAVAISSDATAVDAQQGSALSVHDSRIDGGHLVAKLAGSRLELIDSATRGPISASTSTLVLTRSALTGTTAQDATMDLVDSDLIAERARLALQILTRRVGTDPPLVRIQDSWFGLGPSHLERSCLGAGTADCWLGLRAQGARVEIERTSFDLRTLLVDVIPGAVSEQIGVQITDGRDLRLPAVLRDIFVALPKIDFLPEATLHLVGLALNQRATTEPDQIERVVIVGGAFGALTSSHGWFRIRDYSAYSGAGAGLLGVGADVDAERVEVALSASGVAGGCDHRFRFTDLGVYNTGGIGLHLGGQQAKTTLLRTAISGGHSTEPALRITTKGENMDCERPIGAVVTARQLRIDEGFRYGLDLEPATSIDVTDFLVEVGDVAARFNTDSGVRRLSHGVLRGTQGLFVAPTVDLVPLVDHVLVEATIPVMY